MQVLRKLRSNELAVGMRLPGNVYDKDGAVLLRAGHQLARLDMQALPPRIYADESWPARRSVESVVQEMVSRLGEDEPVPCGRRHERKRWQASLTVVIEQRSENDLIRRELQVTTQDISPSGFSFIYRQFVQPGSVVKAGFHMLPDRPWLVGVVRNCVLLAGMDHRIGVEFTGAGWNRRAPASLPRSSARGFP